MNFTPQQANQLIELYPSVLALEDGLEPTSVKDILVNVQKIMPNEDSVPSPDDVVATESIGGALYSAYRWIVDLFSRLFKWIVNMFGGKKEVITPNQIAQVHEKVEAQYDKKINDVLSGAVTVYDGTIELPRMSTDSLIGAINQTVLSMSKMYKDYAKYIKNVNKVMDELKEGFIKPMRSDGVMPKGDISRVLRSAPKIDEKVNLLGQFKGTTVEDTFVLNYTNNVSSLAMKRYEVTWSTAKTVISDQTKSTFDKDSSAFTDTFSEFASKFETINALINENSDNLVHPTIRASLISLARILLNAASTARLVGHIRSLDRIIFLTANGKNESGMFTETKTYQELISLCNQLNSGSSGVPSVEAIAPEVVELKLPDFEELKALVSKHENTALKNRALALICLERNPRHVVGTWQYNLNEDNNISKTIRADNAVCDRMNMRLLALVDKIYDAVNKDEDVDVNALVKDTISPSIVTTGLSKIRFSRNIEKFIDYIPYGSADLDTHTNLEVNPVDIMDTNTPNLVIINDMLDKLTAIASKVTSTSNPQLEKPLRQISAYLYNCVAKHVNTPYVFTQSSDIDDVTLTDKITFLKVYGKHGNDVTFKFGQRIDEVTADYAMGANVDIYTNNMNKVNNLTYLMCLYIHKDLIAIDKALLLYNAKSDDLTKAIDTFGAKVQSIYDDLPEEPIRMANVTVTFDGMSARETGKVLTVSRGKPEHDHTNVAYVGGLTAPTEELRNDLQEGCNKAYVTLESVGSNMPRITDVDHLYGVRKCFTEATELLTNVKQVLDNVNVYAQDPYAEVQKAYCRSVTTRQK